MVSAGPYTSDDMAGFLGMRRGSFHRAYHRLVASGMPPSLKPGRKAFDRAMVDAWRRAPGKPLVAANDSKPGEPIDWQKACELEYGPNREASR
jgi:hypothetical protein